MAISLHMIALALHDQSSCLPHVIEGSMGLKIVQGMEVPTANKTSDRSSHHSRSAYMSGFASSRTEI
eukprot:5873004-Amphidinium_carterae.1